MNRCAFLLLALLAAPPVAAQGTAVTPPDRMETFVTAAMLSPGPYVLALGGGLIDEVSNFPEEWTGSKGFGQRFAARLGSGFASDAIGHGLAGILRHRATYEACACSGGWKRTRHALSRGFVTRDDAGAVVPHTSLFSAKLGAAGLAKAWYPKSYSGDDVIREALVGVGVNALLNIGREFSPELLWMVGLR